MNLLREGFVNKIILHEVPVSIGDGIRPFEIENADFFLTPIGNTKHVEGVRVREFRVVFGNVK